MSLHVEMSDEAIARLKARKKQSTIMSILISILSIVLIGAILAFVAIIIPAIETPTIVTYQSSNVEEEEFEEKKIQKDVQRPTTTPAATSIAKVITTDAASPVAVSIPVTETFSESLDFGEIDTLEISEMFVEEVSDSFASIPAQLRKRCSKADRLARLNENGGNEAVEDSITSGLNWLQKVQEKDGSWNKGDPAMTGLALLSYLGRCETPLSKDYGDTVDSAISWMINKGMKNDGKFAKNYKDKHWCYEHSIATYALGEAYTFCKNLNLDRPNLDVVLEKAGQWIIDNQHENGGWSYGYDLAKSAHTDSSISGWHVQALKAAKYANIELKNLDKTIKNALQYMEDLQVKDGRVGYQKKGDVAARSRGATLAGIAALCYQIWEKPDDRVVKRAIDYISDEAVFDYDGLECNLYGHYYNMQAMINVGGSKWNKYNDRIRDELLENQNSDGSWKTPGATIPDGKKPNAPAPVFLQNSMRGQVYRNTMNILMLETYFRFLPSTTT